MIVFKFLSNGENYIIPEIVCAHNLLHPLKYHYSFFYAAVTIAFSRLETGSFLQGFGVPGPLDRDL